MIIVYVKISENIGQVQVINHLDNEVTEPNMIKVNTVPEPVYQVGKDSKMLINLSTNELYFEYFDRPLNSVELADQQKTRVSELEAQNAQMLMALVMGGLM